ncbi:MAG: helix-turn-helix domain-containing protein [Bacteroidota bacterium]
MTKIIAMDETEFQSVIKKVITKELISLEEKISALQREIENKTDDKLFTQDEAIARYKISRTKLYWLRKKGQLPFRMLGKTIIFSKNDFEKSMHLTNSRLQER